jgi:hypothetical protein
MHSPYDRLLNVPGPKIPQIIMSTNSKRGKDTKVTLAAENFVPDDSEGGHSDRDGCGR